MKRLALGAALAAILLTFAGPALAHRLKLFVSVESGSISGYGFFIGGGRANAATVVFRDAQGAELHRMQVDGDGEFRWKPPQAQDVKIVLNAGDGHAAEATVAANQFAPNNDPPRAKAAENSAAAPAKTPVPFSAMTREELATLVEKKVDAAVARQIKPLLEAYDKAEGRLRFNDVMGGIGMLIGLAGLAMWASGRRRQRGGDGRDSA
ncbi:MAG: cobalamin biosynthesis protein CbiM [Beijerinckiaceae bacterium]